MNSPKTELSKYRPTYIEKNDEVLRIWTQGHMPNNWQSGDTHPGLLALNAFSLRWPNRGIWRKRSKGIDRSMNWRTKAMPYICIFQPRSSEFCGAFGPRPLFATWRAPLHCPRLARAQTFYMKVCRERACFIRCLLHQVPDHSFAWRPSGMPICTSSHPGCPSFLLHAPLCLTDVYASLLPPLTQDCRDRKVAEHRRRSSRCKVTGSSIRGKPLWSEFEFPPR